MREYLTLLVLLAFTGCSVTAQFVPSGPLQDRPQTDYTKIGVFYDESKVPFPYTEIGRIFLDGKLSAQEQLYKIRDRAAYFGADAVIVKSDTEQESSGGAVKNTAYYESHTAQRYTGIAIIKK